MTTGLTPDALSEKQRKLLFATCFIALIATSFGFMVRIALLNDVWKPQFNLSDTQVGEIFGAGLWPFAISIVLFSLIIDKIGYKVSLWFAVVCHVIQAFMLMTPGAGFVPEDLQATGGSGSAPSLGPLATAPSRRSSTRSSPRSTTSRRPSG